MATVKRKGIIITDGDGGIVIQENGTNTQFNFTVSKEIKQELALIKGAPANFSTVIAADGKTENVVSVIRPRRGKISKINDDGSGQLIENRSKLVIDFWQPQLKDLELETPELVKYDLLNVGGRLLAVNLRDVNAED